MSHQLRFAVLSLILSASTAGGSMALGNDANPGGRTLTGKGN
jgi:hypothetical protein